MHNGDGVSEILRTSREMLVHLEIQGEVEHFSPAQFLFQTGDENRGVYLVRSGKVCLLVEGAPQFDRRFTAGSLLGLPSTFTGNIYSLSAVAVTATDVLHVPAKKFLQVMQSHLELCREATEMLSREVAFIQNALAQRRSQTSHAGEGQVAAKAKVRAGIPK